MMKTWNYIDKTQWPERGPWDSEPDKAQWMDESTGLICLMVRARGHWCGYVGVPDGHPAFDKDYNDLDIDVHGGLTFAGFCQPKDQVEPKICHMPEEDQPEHVYWMGFDCAHCGDKRPATDIRIYEVNQAYLIRDEVYRDLNYVKSEVERLAAQLVEMKSV